MHPATTPDGPAAAPDMPGPELARWRVVLRLLAMLLAGLWTGLALVVLLAYRPGGPLDLPVALSVALPAAVSALAIVWPPLSRTWRRAVAIAWLGMGSALLVGPLVGLVVTQLVSGGGQTLLPSPEVAYAAVLAAGGTSLYAAFGIIAARDGRLDPDGLAAALDRRASVFSAIALGLVLTTVMGVTFGATLRLNEIAMRESPVPPSRYGPTDATLSNPECATPMAIGPGATLEMTAEAFIDDEPVGLARLRGIRAGTDESWTASADGPSGPIVTGYTRVGGEAWLLDGGRWVPSTPDPFDLLGINALTVDGPVAVAARRPDRPPVAEDVGLELIAGAKARHCRTAIDGPTALRTMLPVRWLVGDEVEVTAELEAWRGTLDWWVFADGQLGVATLTINGYPGDVWAPSGLQGEIHVRMTAIDREFAHGVQAPDDVVRPSPGPASPPVDASPPVAGSPPAVRGSPPVVGSLPLGSPPAPPSGAP